ncbi:MAG: hypothetical protein ABL920_00120 [Methylotenera sp.]
MYLFECQVKVPVSSWMQPIIVRINANNVPEAWGMLKAQYGASNVIGVPVLIS